MDETTGTLGKALLEAVRLLAAAFKTAKDKKLLPSSKDASLLDEWETYAPRIQGLVSTATTTGQLDKVVREIYGNLKIWDARLLAATGITSGATAVIVGAESATQSTVDKAIGTAAAALGQEVDKALKNAGASLISTLLVGAVIIGGLYWLLKGK